MHREIAEKGHLETNVRIPTTHLRRILLRQPISGDTADGAVHSGFVFLDPKDRGWPVRRQDDRDGAGTGCPYGPCGNYELSQLYNGAVRNRVCLLTGLPPDSPRGHEIDGLLRKQ